MLAGELPNPLIRKGPYKNTPEGGMHRIKASAKKELSEKAG